jgi:hypothetical protein
LGYNFGSTKLDLSHAYSKRESQQGFSRKVWRSKNKCHKQYRFINLTIWIINSSFIKKNNRLEICNLDGFF